jgi:hypothetical protein
MRRANGLCDAGNSLYRVDQPTNIDRPKPFRLFIVNRQV